MAVVSVSLMGCQPADEAALIYDVSNERFFVAQWGEARRFVECHQGYTEQTTPSVKPRRRDTRVTHSFSDPIKVFDKEMGLRNFHRANFYECKRA
jgi:hypothetical protein